jgi:hypothetical protein
MARAGFAAEGEAILLFGAPDWWGTHLGQSIYLRDLFGRPTARRRRSIWRMKRRSATSSAS